MQYFVSLPSGIDSEGHAANYVETEQIVQYNSAKASFVQVSHTCPGDCCSSLRTCSLVWFQVTSYFWFLFFYGLDKRVHPILLVSEAKSQVQA